MINPYLPTPAYDPDPDDDPDVWEERRPGVVWYRVGESGGFVAGFSVDLLFDRNYPGDAFDLVGVEATCGVCRRRSTYLPGFKFLARALLEHAAEHEPPSIVEGPGGPDRAGAALEAARRLDGGSGPVAGLWRP